MREEAPLRDEPAGELLITDGLILRPAGLAASVVGLAAAVLLTPWAMFSHSEDRLCRELIQKPFRYTFERPLGDVENTTGK